MIKSILKLIIYSNILVSLGALLLATETFFFLNLNIYSHLKPLFLIFFSTLFIYNYQRVIAFKNKANHLQSARHIWIDKNQKLLIGITITSAITSLILALLIVNKTHLIFCFNLFFLAFFYSTPMFKKKNNWYRLRDLPFAKLFIIGFVWSVTVVVFPIIELSGKFEKINILYLFLVQFLFIVSITIPFDIRDYDIDNHNKIKTLPVTLGIKNSKLIAYILVIVGVAISILFLYSNIIFLITEIVFSTLSILLIKKSLPTNNDFYFTIYIDGLMVLKPLLFILLIFIKNNL